MNLDSLLPEGARATLDRANDKRLSYAVRYLMSPEGRLIVAVGEAHIKLAAASALGKEIVAHFALRGVETFPMRKVVGGRALWLLIHLPRLLLRTLAFGFIKGSTITDAKALPNGVTFELEGSSAIPLGLHVGALYLGALFFVFWLQMALALAQMFSLRLDPRIALITTIAFAFQLHTLLLVPAWMLRRWQWSWVIHPAVAILTLRDTIMAEGTVVMLREVPGPRAAVVIMGRAHLAGYERELVEKHEFRRVA